MSHRLSHLPEYDWREAAKSASAVVDDNAVEKAFADQAYGLVANKVGPIMRDPYQLGFEIVSKNDANTRMVGLFAFRLDGTLLYVPAFFLNGEIKGTDLLYRYNVKRFCPNTEDWITYLREHGNQSMGKGIDRSESRSTPSRVRLDRIAYPPHLKTASGEDPDWAGFFDELSEQTKQASEHPLKDFLVECGNRDMLKRLGDLIEKSAAFAEAIVDLPEDVYMPPEMHARWDREAAEAAATKSASEEQLVLYTGLHEDCIKSGSADFASRHGFFLEDKRAKEGLTAVYVDYKDELCEVGAPVVT